MIFIINQTNKKLQLKADQTEFEATGMGATDDIITTVSVCTDDYEFPIVATDDAKLAVAMLERFGTPEKIRNNKSKHNFKVDGRRLLMDIFYDCDVPEDSGLVDTIRMFSQPYDEKFPKKYTCAKDVVVIVHNNNDIVSIDKDDLTNGHKVEVMDERGEITVTVLPIKWYNWSTMTPTRTFEVGKTSYRLGYKKHKYDDTKVVNTVIEVKGDKIADKEEQNLKGGNSSNN